MLYSVKGHLALDDHAWTQVSLPVSLGRLGVRSVVVVAPSAFLASSHASAELIDLLLPGNSHLCPYVDDALVLWSLGHCQPPPEGVDAGKQKAWDGVRVCLSADRLLQNAKDESDRVRLLAVSTKESGAWLETLPLSSMGLWMDDNTLRVSVGLSLGIPICGPHACQHCGCVVDTFGEHGLSCKKNVTVITATVPSMTLSRRPLSQLTFLAGLSLRVCFVVMVNVPVMLPWCP